MEFRMHLGILLLTVIAMLMWWVGDETRRKNYTWYIPIIVGGFLFIIFEVIFWIIVLCFL